MNKCEITRSSHDTKHLYKSRSCFYAYCVNAVIKAHRTDYNRFFCLEYDENIDGIIEAGSCSNFLSKDIETYGIVKLPKRD
jgi:hypothetical protein